MEKPQHGNVRIQYRWKETARHSQHDEMDTEENMTRLAYPVILIPWNGTEEGYTVKVPDVPGCITEGFDLTDALNMAADAIRLILSDDLEAGLSVPVPSDPSAIKVDSPGSLVRMVVIDMDR